MSAEGGRRGLWWARLKGVVVHRILGVQDTPHRIAWGMAIGTVIAFTPTIGLQVMLYLLFATVLRANKLSGVPILFISNPVTAVPLYYGCWRLGVLLLGSSADEGGDRSRFEAFAGGGDLGDSLLSAEFWSAAWDTLKDVGAELWLGSVALGVAFAIPFYFLTRVAVVRFRARRSKAPDGASSN
ncbi:MAG: DUF2062 domain-containing protein [Myxococcota bacterium]